MSEIVLYHTGCPKCKILREKLDAAEVSYTEVTDKDYLISIGVKSVPVLNVKGERLLFRDAVAWVAANGGK